MPCGGPSQGLAYRQGDEATDEILKLLKEKYAAFKMPLPEKGNLCYGFMKEHNDKFDVLEKTLRDTVKELIWNSDSLW